MYTGVIEATGRVGAIEDAESGCRIEIEAATGDLARGDSVGVSGVCLTAEQVGDGWFRAFLAEETLRRTYLGDLEPGAAVNVERPLAADGRFDGHVVKGTVDATAAIVGVEDLGASEDWRFAFAIPEGYAQYVVEKGAVALDGISLTVADVRREAFEVAVVPETYRLTTLSEKAVGDPVHFEADLLAKYVERAVGGA